MCFARIRKGTDMERIFVKIKKEKEKVEKKLEGHVRQEVIDTEMLKETLLGLGKEKIGVIRQLCVYGSNIIETNVSISKKFFLKFRHTEHQINFLNGIIGFNLY